MKKRFTEQQIVGSLKEAEAGIPVKELWAQAHPDVEALKVTFGIKR